MPVELDGLGSTCIESRGWHAEVSLDPGQDPPDGVAAQ
jgi:hypothetical protein